MSQFAVGALNRVRRPDRAVYDREAIHAVLDEGLVAHVGFIQEHRPIVLPMAYARHCDTLFLHGAKAARFAKVMGAGVPVCITVTLADGIVVARSAFHCSMNYRSVMIHGHARLVTDHQEAETALAAITDHLLPGRWAESRPVMEKEVRATAVLRIEIEAAALKARSGPPVDDDEDYELPIWGGVVPLYQGVRHAVDDGRVRGENAVPQSVLKRCSKSG